MTGGEETAYPKNDAAQAAEFMVQTMRQFIRKTLRRGFTAMRKQMSGGRLLVKQGEVYYAPLWLLLALALLLVLAAGDDAMRLAERALGPNPPPSSKGEIADFFAPSVHYWSGKISEWADMYEVEPQLLATVMQIESCGHPKAVSGAGARGLFQVMPFHFADGEDMLDPDTNAKRGGLFLNYCHQAADGVIGAALACYNGGPTVIDQPMRSWRPETQRYYRWGVGMYSDAITGQTESDTLNQWMAAGGGRLCASALDELKSYPPAASP